MPALVAAVPYPGIDLLLFIPDLSLCALEGDVVLQTGTRLHCALGELPLGFPKQPLGFPLGFWEGQSSAPGRARPPQSSALVSSHSLDLQGTSRTFNSLEIIDFNFFFLNVL